MVRVVEGQHVEKGVVTADVNIGNGFSGNDRDQSVRNVDPDAVKDNVDILPWAKALG